jgi:hypothetical protein
VIGSTSATKLIPPENTVECSLYARRTNDVKSKCRLAPGPTLCSGWSLNSRGAQRGPRDGGPLCVQAPVVGPNFSTGAIIFYILSGGESYPLNCGGQLVPRPGMPLASFCASDRGISVPAAVVHSSWVRLGRLRPPFLLRHHIGFACGFIT